MDKIFQKPAFIKAAYRDVSGLRFAGEIFAFILCFIFYVVLQSVALAAVGADNWPISALANAQNFTTGFGILIALLFCRVIEKRGPRTLGFVKKGMGPEYLRGLAIGFGSFAICVLAGVALGTVEFNGFMPNIPWGYILLFFLTYLVQGLNEEVLMRGYLMVTLTKKVPLWAAAVISSLIFSLLHLINPGANFISVFNVFIVGFVLALFVIRRGNIWLAAGFHSAWNFTQGNIFGLSVSGNEVTDAVFNMKIAAGNPMITGGNFGMEASIVATVFFVIVTLVMFKLKPVDLSAPVSDKF